MYTEIYADRVALEVTGDLEACVSTLVKVETGLAQVSGASYLKQAEEILGKGDFKSQGISHPELYIRARALALWQEKGDAAEEDVEKWLRGGSDLDSLDWLGQSRLTELSRRFLEQLLRPEWIRTPEILAHAELCFEGIQPASDGDEELAEEIKKQPEAVRELFLWLLADFVAVEPDLEELPLSLALDWSARIEMEARLEEIAKKDLGIKVRDLKRIKKDAAKILMGVKA